MIEPGDIIKVKDWPNTLGERFRVQKVIPNVQDPSRPASVYAFRIERDRREAAFRAFPEDHCTVVRKTEVR